MGLKAGWLALFVFVWVIGAFLGSTFEYQLQDTGMIYSAGTANFTNGSNVVAAGGIATWNSTMIGGWIQLTADAPLPCKIIDAGGQATAAGTASFVHGSTTVIGGGGATWVAAMASGVIRSTADPSNRWYKIRDAGGQPDAGNANFTNGNVRVTGVGTAWVSGMEGGLIRCDADGYWHKVGDVVSPTVLTLVAPYTGVTTVPGGVPYTMVTALILFTPYTSTSIPPVDTGAAAYTMVTGVTIATSYTGAAAAAGPYTMVVGAGWAGTGTGGYATSPTSKFQYLTNINNAVQHIELLGAIPFIVPNSQYFSTAFEVLTWQWSFLYNPDGTMVYGMFYLVFCLPFIVMGVLCMILLVYGILTGNLSL